MGVIRDKNGQAYDERNPLYVADNNKTHYVYSTDPRPSARKGDALIEFDTKDVYLYDGSSWVMF